MDELKTQCKWTLTFFQAFRSLLCWSRSNGRPDATGIHNSKERSRVEVETPRSCPPRQAYRRELKVVGHTYLGPGGEPRVREGQVQRGQVYIHLQFGKVVILEEWHVHRGVRLHMAERERIKRPALVHW